MARFCLLNAGYSLCTQGADLSSVDQVISGVSQHAVVTEGAYTETHGIDHHLQRYQGVKRAIESEHHADRSEVFSANTQLRVDAKSQEAIFNFHYRTQHIQQFGTRTEQGEVGTVTRMSLSSLHTETHQGLFSETIPHHLFETTPDYRAKHHTQVAEIGARTLYSDHISSQYDMSHHSSLGMMVLSDCVVTGALNGMAIHP